MEISNYTKAHSDLRNKLEYVVPMLSEREDVLTFAAATLVATELPMPSEPVQDVRRWLLDNYVDDVFRMLSALNEVQPIKVRYAEELVMKLVQMRCFVAWPTNIDTGIEAKCFLGGFLGAHRFLSPEEVETLNAKSATIFALLPAMRALINL